MNLNAKELARYIDHTQLKPQARREDIERLCAEAVQYGFYSVCVNGQWVAHCQNQLANTNVKISAVVGFPLGAAHPRVKAYEAANAVEQGASEIDMVLPVGPLIDQDHSLVEKHIRAVVEAVQDQAVVKVILETGLLTPELIQLGCQIAEQAGAGFVKTSTGFGPGGAAEEDVRLMRASVGSSVGVKASGGIRDTQTARKMIAAGATRLGTSASVAIITGLQSEDAGQQSY